MSHVYRLTMIISEDPTVPLEDRTPLHCQSIEAMMDPWAGESAPFDWEVVVAIKTFTEEDARRIAIGLVHRSGHTVSTFTNCQVV